MTRSTLILIASAAAVGVASYRYTASIKPVVVRAASTPATTRLIAGAGRVEPASEEIRIGSQLDGRLATVPVAEGQIVHRGQVLAILDNGEFQARVQLAQATVARREAELERLHNGSRQQERRESDALVREAEAVLDSTRIERQRRAGLLERGAISRFEFDTADREYNVARARCDAARERSSLVVDATRPEDIKRAMAEVDRATAELAEARSMLTKTIIRSPIDGMVLRKKLKAGESVYSRGDMPIVTLGDCSSLRVRMDVDENDVARIRVGQSAWVRADAFGERKFMGKVTRIGQILGRKNVRTDEPSERVDAKILETLIELEPGVSIPIGMRVDAFIDPRS